MTFQANLLPSQRKWAAPDILLLFLTTFRHCCTTLIISLDRHSHYIRIALVNSVCQYTNYYCQRLKPTLNLIALKAIALSVASKVKFASVLLGITWIEVNNLTYL